MICVSQLLMLLNLIHSIVMVHMDTTLQPDNVLLFQTKTVVIQHKLKYYIMQCVWYFLMSKFGDG